MWMDGSATKKMHPMLEKQCGRLLLHGIGILPLSAMSTAIDIPAMPPGGAASAFGTDCPRPAHKKAPRTKSMNQCRVEPNRMGSR